MQSRTYLLTAVTLLFFCASAQHSPLSADQIMHEAMQQATNEKKNVFIIFHASWCGWCRKMDSSINDKDCKKFFDDNYVIRHLVVNESRDKKNMENPGAEEFRAKYNGKDLGLPSWLIFDKDGNLLADSQIRPQGANLATQGDNIGCPATENEVRNFIEILKKTSHLAPSQQAEIEKRFLQNDDRR